MHEGVGHGPVSEDSPSDAQALSHREILTVLAGLMTAMLLAALDQTIVATALPTIVGELGGLTQLSWVVTAYLLASTVSVPLYGKISDLYGRKRLFQVSIVVFVVGSVASGLAQSMGQLISFRAVQGVGAGGLLALTYAIIGDIVSPRQRGRYIGYISAVWALSSVAGPLVGGLLVDSFSWRWMFFINVPLGGIALAVTQRNFRMPFVRRSHRIDYVGGALLSAAIIALLLVTLWGGRAFPWTSGVILGLAIVGVGSLLAFVLVERRAVEPILPLELFSDPVFRVAGALAFLVGAAMVGSIIFIPLFLQVVSGMSATSSGIILLPLVGASVTGVISSGRLTARWGRYKVFPVTGTALMIAGMALMSTMDAATTRGRASLYMVVIGLGVGLVVPVLMLAVQNSVPTRHLGTATSSTQLLRSLGGTVGVAMFGALLNARVVGELAGNIPEGIGTSFTAGPEAIGQLPPAIREAVREAIAGGITGVFLLAVPLTVIAFALALFLREVPLRTTAPGAAAEGALGLVEVAEAGVRERHIAGRDRANLSKTRS